MKKRFHALIQNCLVILFIMFLLGGCKSKKTEVSAYDSYKFDQEVIKKLPLYDSIATAILRKLPLYLQKINADDAYHAFRYMPGSDEEEVFKKLPAEVGPEVEQYIQQLGKDYLYAFDIFKDSTIKIYVRRSIYGPTAESIKENLSYYPEGKSISKREFPIRDTTLGPHWQYWTRFDTPGLF